MRDVLGECLLRRGERDPDLVVLDADLSTSTRTSKFAGAFPNRFFNLGIAEHDLLGVATGLALRGHNVVVSGFTVFTLGRGWDFLRAACHDRLPVKVLTTHSGLSAALDGGTHQCVEDLALACSIPHLVVLVPADDEEARQVVDWALDSEGPTFVRLQRNSVPRTVPEDYAFQFGRWQTLREGDDVTIVATGALVGTAIEASKSLRSVGVSAAVLDASTVKPLDAAAVEKAALRTGALVVVEEHNLLTGLGSQVCRVTCQRVTPPVPVECVGVPDRFGQSGTYQELLEWSGLTAANVQRAALRAVRRKEGLG
ncbi:MAG: transketolase family protein [Promethearchaeota archaeon]